MALVEEILKQYPDCDRMMAETITKMHEQGKLEEFLPALREPPPQVERQTGGIEVHPPEEKTSVKTITWSEDKSAA